MKNYCSIQLFHQALHNTHLFVSINPTSIEALCRTTHFAECRAVVDGAEVLLHAPISPEAMALAERTYATLRGDRGERIGGFRILNNELDGHIAILIETMPEGETLSSAMLTHSHQRLHMGFREFVERLRQADISHNNLRKESIIVDSNGYWHPIRLYNTSVGYGCDSERLDALRTEIEQLMTTDNCVNEPLSAYRTEYIPLCEGLRRITTAKGVGFADESGAIVIEPRYSWASDFDEGRAMVMTAERKMGLIDTKGREVIAPIYEIVEYSATEGNSWVRYNNLWALFDYSGLQITDWEEREVVDDGIYL